jgi:MOSC domain-containing protein YiiM
VRAVTASGLLVSVNTGAVGPLTAGRRTVESGIVKSPVAGRVRVEGSNVAGDRQADLRVHGGPDKAVYAYAEEDYAWWGRGLGTRLAPGTFGENLTVSGLAVSGAVVGERWEAGTALLEVAQPRLPCYKLGMRMGDPVFVARFAAANRPGAYLRIVEAGEIGAGDAIRVVDRPAHGVTVAEVSRALLGEREMWAPVLRAPQLPEGVRRHLSERLEATGGAA